MPKHPGLEEQALEHRAARLLRAHLGAHRR